MATINDTNPTLLDIVKATDPGGMLSKVVEVLSERNELMKYLTWKEGNLTTGHTYTSELALPSVGWRRFNEGVAASKGTNEQFTEPTAMLSSRCQVDVKLAQLNGNAAAYRFEQGKRFIRAMQKEFNETLWYGNIGTAPSEIDGFATRLGSTTGEHGATQMVTNGTPGGADQHSIWLIGFSPDTVYGIYPRSSVAGLDHTDMGEQLVSDGTNQYRAYVDTWDWNVGLVIQDYRYVVRGYNVDHSALTADASGNSADLPDLMHQMIGKLESTEGVRPVFFMNRTVFSYLQRQIASKAQSIFEYVTASPGKGGAGEGGRLVPHFMGIPIAIDDNLLDGAEDLVS